MADDSNNSDKWEKAVLGESVPNSNDPLEKKANAVRQIILWKDAQRLGDESVSPYEASVIFRSVKRITRRERLTRYGLLGLLLLLTVLVVFMANKLLIRYKDGAMERQAHVEQHKDLENATNELPFMLNLPAGSFTLGCENGWDDKLGSCSSVEKPPREMEVEAFALAKFETTVGQFKKFVAETGYLTVAEVDSAGCTIRGQDIEWVLSKAHHWKNPGYAQTDLHPVVCISWTDAQAYTRWLSEKTGVNYRLPTEAEWEYAARSREISPFYWGDAPNRNFANYRGTGEADTWEHAAPVGKLAGNNFFLHDMAGNVWEWVDSCWTADHNSACLSETEKVRKGGSFFDSPRNIRHAYRSHDTVGARSFLYGFRVAHGL